MRRLLDGLAQMAARTSVSILVITHMNKRSDARKAMQMIAGSHVIVAAVRVVLVTARDPNDKARRLLLPVKLNIGLTKQDSRSASFPRRIRSAATCRPSNGSRKACQTSVQMTCYIDSSPRAQAAVEKSCESTGLAARTSQT